MTLSSFIDRSEEKAFHRKQRIISTLGEKILQKQPPWHGNC